MITDRYLSPTILEYGVNVLAYVNPSDPPTAEGLDYTSSRNRLHYSADENRLHFTTDRQRLHYTAEDN